MATFRTDELHRRHPLTAWLAEADRQPRVERSDLARFRHDDLVELLGQLTSVGSEPFAATLIDSVARRSDGNAFFAEELVASIDETGGWGDRLPETLRGVLLVRLSSRSDAAARLVEIAAVGGREVAHDVLDDVCGLDEPALAAALHEAVDAQLLLVGRDASVDRYRFRHALVQEAAYDQLLPSERRRLHEAYAVALEARPAASGAAEASRLVELAHHWRSAHEATRALHAADRGRRRLAGRLRLRRGRAPVRAGDRAVGPVAPDDRRPIVTWATCTTTRAPRPPSSAMDPARSASPSGPSSWSMPRPAPTCDRERRARARERLGFAAWLAGDTATSIQLLEEAVALLDGAPPSTAQSRVLAGLAANLMLAGRSSDSIPVAERAIEHARTTGDRGIESRATGVLGVDRAYLGDLAGGIELLRRSLAMASPADDPLAVPRAHVNLGSVLEMGGFVEEALEVSLAGAAEHPGLRQRAQLPHIPRGQRGDLPHRARTLPGGGRAARGQRRPGAPRHRPDPPAP